MLERRSLFDRYVAVLSSIWYYSKCQTSSTTRFLSEGLVAHGVHNFLRSPSQCQMVNVMTVLMPVALL